MPLRSVTKLLAGWGNYPVQTCALFRPEKIGGVREVVRGADGRGVIARGLGRSYGDAALNADGGVVLCERLNRFLSVDPNSAVVEAEGGMSLAEMINVFLPRGWFLPVTPGTKFVTLAGAIAADVHGKNHHRDGCISEFVESFQLLLANDEIWNCSRDENPDVFWATIGGMGLTGVILAAKIRLIRVDSAYVTVDTRKASHLDEALELFARNDADYQYSVAWIDCLASGGSLGRSVLMRGNHTPVAQLPSRQASRPFSIERRRTKSVPFNMPRFALNHFSVSAFNAMYYAKHDDARQVTTYDEFFYPLDGISH